MSIDWGAIISAMFTGFNGADGVTIIAIVVIAIVYLKNNNRFGKKGTEESPGVTVSDFSDIVKENTKTSQEMASLISELTQWLKLTRESDKERSEEMYKRTEQIPQIGTNTTEVLKVVQDIRDAQSKNCTECLTRLRHKDEG